MTLLVSTISQTRVKSPMRILVVGAGYVGLANALGLTGRDHEVVCIDIDTSRCEILNSGKSPIYEEGFESVLRNTVSTSRLTFVSDYNNLGAEYECAIVCLPTPSTFNGEADLTFVTDGLSRLAQHMQRGSIVVVRSTVPPDSFDLLIRSLGRDDISLAHMPEFLREGRALSDFKNPDRVVIGASSNETIRQVVDIFGLCNEPVVNCSLTEASLIKYASNSYLAMRLSYFHSLSSLANAVGADSRQVIRGVGLDSRIGVHFAEPAIAWGGSCFPKDTREFVAFAARIGHDMDLVATAITANSKRVQATADMVSHCVEEVSNPRVAVLGIAFKPDTGDVRSSAGVDLAIALADRGMDVSMYDPIATLADSSLNVPDNIIQYLNIGDALNGADVVVLATAWREFKDIRGSDAAGFVRGRSVHDPFFLLNREEWTESGFEFVVQ